MNRLGTFIVSVALAPMLALPAFAQSGNSTAPNPDPGYGYGPMWGWGYGHHMGWWGPGYYHPFGGVLMTLFAVLLVVLLIRAISFGFGGRYGRFRFRHGGYGHGTSALDILEERFAKGEIDKNEFEEKRKLLMR
jgi:putative membrane protein